MDPAEIPYKESVKKSICTTPDEETKSFKLSQVMLRIKDPHASLDFYTRILGFTLLYQFHFKEGKFSIYILKLLGEKTELPKTDEERKQFAFDQEATLELTHNWGTENDPDFKHHNGNTEPKGFGHIGITVPDVYKVCERLEKLGVKFIKTPDGGKMKGLAFIQDPDGYWIEILAAKTSIKSD